MQKDRRSTSIPNERLKRERLLRSWTQADVAGFLGTDGYTVNRWERGRARPSAYFQRQLCELFGKNAQELGLVPHTAEGTGEPPSPVHHALPVFWSVPHLRNPYFTGREEILQMVHTHLSTCQPVALTQSYALHGLGGIGKTQLALEYAYRYASTYRAIFWIEAETGEQITASLVRIAEIVQLPERNEADQQRITLAVQRWLCAQGGWLLIWDNLEDPQLLTRFLQPAPRGAILITTRRQALGTLAPGVDLEPMEEEEGIRFVLRRAKWLEPHAPHKQIQVWAERAPAEYTAAVEMVRTLGGLPLALDQAGAYLEETGCCCADYLQRYEQQRLALLQRRGLVEGGHPQSVATTFGLAYERLAAFPEAADLLRVCAQLYAEAIPEELFGAGATHLGPALAPLTADPGQLDRAVAILRSLSLVQRQAETHTLSLHRLVQVVVQEKMSEQERDTWLKRVIAALDAIFPDVISHTWAQCERLLPHVLTIAATLPDDMGSLQLARIVRKAADYLRERVQYDQARQLYRLALRIWDHMPARDAEMARPFNGLALLCGEHGQYDQAEELYGQALLVLEQTLGPTHPEVTRPLNNLANLYTLQGKYLEAECLYQQTQLICERTLGSEHIWVAYALANLAETYREQGRYELVQPLCERALRIWRQALGPEHSLLIHPLLTLARLACEQGNYTEAKRLYQQAQAIWEKTFQGAAPPPAMAEVFNGLAQVYAQTGKYAEAESWYRRALSVQVPMLGTEHPETADALNGLANLYAQQGKKKQARRLFHQALHIRETRLGQDHPKTAQTLQDLATFSHEQGNLEEALTLMKRVLSIRSLRLGSSHPKTLATRAYYTQLLQEQEETGGFDDPEKHGTNSATTT